MRRIHTNYAFLLSPFMLDFTLSKLVCNATTRVLGRSLLHFFAFLLAREARSYAVGPTERRVLSQFLAIA